MREQICRRAVGERLLRALMVVETEVAFQRCEQIGPAGEVAGVDEFVLQAAPQALDENEGVGNNLYRQAGRRRA